MLVLTGMCLGTSAEIVKGQNGNSDFESVTFAVLTGDGVRSSVQQVRAGRDFKRSDFPTDGEEISLVVVVSAYAGRNGAGYRLTALDRVRESETV